MFPFFSYLDLPSTPKNAILPRGSYTFPIFLGDWPEGATSLSFLQGLFRRWLSCWRSSSPAQSSGSHRCRRWFRWLWRCGFLGPRGSTLRCEFGSVASHVTMWVPKMSQTSKSHRDQKWDDIFGVWLRWWLQVSTIEGRFHGKYNVVFIWINMIQMLMTHDMIF